MKPPTVYKLSKESVERIRQGHIGIKHAPGYSEKQSAIMKQIHVKPETRLINSIAHKKYYAENPHRRKEISDYLKSRYKDPKFKQQIKERLVESWVGGFWYGNVKYSTRPQYCEKFNDDFKERCRAYWNWECVVCGIPESEDKRLSVHHVHYDKKMCCNGSPKDVVSLCHSCHTATNFNRDKWKEQFTKLIYEDHNGKSYLTKEEYSELISND